MKKRLANKIRSTIFDFQNFDSNYQPYSRNQQLKSIKNYFADILAPLESKRTFREELEDMTLPKVSRKEYKEKKRVHPMISTMIDLYKEKETPDNA